MELQKTQPKPIRVDEQATIYTPPGRRNDGWSSGAATAAKRKAAAIGGTATPSLWAEAVWKLDAVVT